MSDSEDDILLQKRRNQMFVEFDSSPLQPKIMAEAEENNDVRRDLSIGHETNLFQFV